MNKLNKCREIREIMVDYLSGEFTGIDPQAAILEKHLQHCSDCKREYVLLNNIFHETRQIDQEANAVMAAIDWKENARDISLGVHINQIRRPSRAWNFLWQPGNWKLAIPVLAAVFILGICLGYFLFYQGHQKPLPVDELLKQEDNVLMQRLETALTRREMQGYFVQTQLLLTDLMRQCN
ncbi:MAG: zf-HC2 domain-containing protein, partial [Acidobacteria bacterium]|nr:zf-HC2 domain-containing protein [Acidobacteriota bacterium]